MYIFWAETDFIKYSLPYRWQLLKFRQPFHQTRLRTIVNGLYYPQSLGAKGILVAASAVFLSNFETQLAGSVLSWSFNFVAL